MLLLPALTKGDEKVIGGLACLLSEIGQAVRFDYVILYFVIVLFQIIFEGFFAFNLSKDLFMSLVKMMLFSFLDSMSLVVMM